MSKATKRTTRPRGFAPWKPDADTIALLDDVRDVLAAVLEVEQQERSRLVKQVSGLLEAIS